MVVLTRGYVVALRERFEVFLRAMGLSAATRRAYLSAVDRYLAFAVPDTPDAERTAELTRFLATRRRTVSQATINMDLTALTAWFRWMEIAAPDDWRPVKLPRRRRPPARLVRALSDAEVGLLLAAPDLTTFVGLRDHFAIATLYQCGLRASELAGLQIGSVLPDGYLLVLGKGGDERLVPYGESWRGLFEGYMRMRQTVRPGKRSALFVTRHGRALRDGRSVWVIVNRYARRALGLHCGFTRLEKSYCTRPWTGHYPHMLRASFATELMRRGVDLMAIAQMLGHADVATTQYYLGVDIGHLRKAVAVHPRAKREQAGGASEGDGEREGHALPLRQPAIERPRRPRRA